MPKGRIFGERIILTCSIFFFIIITDNLAAQKLQLSLPPSPARSVDQFLAFSFEVTSLPAENKSSEQRNHPDLVLVLWANFLNSTYTYGPVQGPVGSPVQVQASLAGSAKALRVIYPETSSRESFPGSGQEIDIYKGQVPFFIPLPANKQLAGSKSPEQDSLAKTQVNVRVQLLLCSEAFCWPVDKKLTFHPDPQKNIPPAEKEPWWPDYLRLAESALSAAGTAKGTSQTGEAGAVRAKSMEPELAPSDSIYAILKPVYDYPFLEVGNLGAGLLMGLLAGFLLNFMPCVLPVIGIKLHSLLAVSSLSRPSDSPDHSAKPASFKPIVRHCRFFALGILVFFALLGILTIFLGLVWGQLFQYPAFILGVAVLIFVLALGLCGFFTLPAIDLFPGQDIKKFGNRPGLAAFLEGLFVTLLATPCSGPLLGAVLAYALGSSSAGSVAMLLCVGLGMASPYLLVSFKPGLTRWLPRSGSWMEVLRILTGFLLIAVALYFLSMLPIQNLFPALVAILSATFILWIVGRLERSFSGRFKKVLLSLGALAMIIGMVFWAATPAPDTETPHAESIHGEWQLFKSEDFTSNLGQNNLLLSFTAEWCPTCKILEKTVLTPENLRKWREKYGIVPVKVDLSKSSAPGWELLKALGSHSIPLTAIFSKAAPEAPLVIRDIFTTRRLEEALEDSLSAAERF